MLLVGALLFVRSFRNLMTFDPGMREGGITAGFLGFWQSNLPPDRWLEYKRQLLEEVRATPGVLDAATTSNVPLLGSSWEHDVRVGSVEANSKFTWVSPGYFNTMGIPVVRGRGFDRNDTNASTRVAVVNQTFARRLVGSADPDRADVPRDAGRGLSDHSLRDRRRDPGHAIQRFARQDAPDDFRAGLAIALAWSLDRPVDPFEHTGSRAAVRPSSAGWPPRTPT